MSLHSSRNLSCIDLDESTTIREEKNGKEVRLNEGGKKLASGKKKRGKRVTREKSCYLPRDIT